MSKFNQIHKAIREGRINNAIELLSDFEQNFGIEFKDEVSLISSRYIKLEDDRRKDIISLDQHNIEHNKIVNSITRLISKHSKNNDVLSLSDEVKSRIATETRRIMVEIMVNWRRLEQKEQQEVNNELINNLTKDERDRFKKFYNVNYHSDYAEKEKRNLSAKIHDYLSTLSKINVQSTNNKEFMEEFGHGMHMHSKLIELYLEAHWVHHGEDKKKLENRFWYKSLKVLQMVEEWINKKN